MEQRRLGRPPGKKPRKDKVANLKNQPSTGAVNSSGSKQREQPVPNLHSEILIIEDRPFDSEDEEDDPSVWDPHSGLKPSAVDGEASDGEHEIESAMSLRDAQRLTDALVKMLEDLNEDDPRDKDWLPVKRRAKAEGKYGTSKGLCDRAAFAFTRTPLQRGEADSAPGPSSDPSITTALSSPSPSPGPSSSQFSSNSPGPSDSPSRASSPSRDSLSEPESEPLITATAATPMREILTPRKRTHHEIQSPTASTTASPDKSSEVLEISDDKVEVVVPAATSAADVELRASTSLNDLDPGSEDEGDLMDSVFDAGGEEPRAKEEVRGWQELRE